MSPLSGAALVKDLERRFTTDREPIDVGDSVITILRPRNSDDLITEEDYVRDERLPYWADVWPSSRILAGHVLSHHRKKKNSRTPHRFLELGCGAGLVSVAAMSAGHAVTASDYYDDALDFTRANGFLTTGREPVTRMVNWRHYPADLGTFEMIVAADVLYEKEYPELILAAIESSLAPGGIAIVADPGRIAAPEFLEAAARDFCLTTESFPFAHGEIRQTIALHSLTR